MTKNSPEETKFLLLSFQLVDQLKEASSKHGVSITSYATEILEAGLKLDKMGATANEAVSTHQMTELNRSAGAISIPRSTFYQLLEILTIKQFNELKESFIESGKWFGEYIKNKIESKEIPKFLEKELKNVWNLDEIEISGSDELSISLASFSMTEKCTELLLEYTSSIFTVLGYQEIHKDHLRGMASLQYRKKRRT